MYTDNNAIRDVFLGDSGYRLQTWYAGISDNRVKVAYRFTDPEGTVLFEGADYSPGALVPMESDEALRCLLGFFFVGKNDIEEGYFANYSPEAIKFRDSADREYLSGYGDLDEDAEAYPLIDVE